MRPKSTTADLPTTYDVKVNLHNRFVEHIKTLKEEIIVSLHHGHFKFGMRTHHH